MIGMDVLSSTNLQHLCCELRKVHGLKTEYTARPGYREFVQLNMKINCADSKDLETRALSAPQQPAWGASKFRRLYLTK